MLFKINGGFAGLIISVIVLTLFVTWYIYYSFRLGKKYILECSICGNQVKKKAIFLVNQSHDFFRTHCDHCHKKEYFSFIEDKKN
jgi:hypothetical protein